MSRQEIKTSPYKVHVLSTGEPVLKGRPICHKIMVSQDRWSLVTGSFTLKCVTFCQKLLVIQDRWSLMAVVSQDRFHCSSKCSIQYCFGVCPTQLLGGISVPFGSLVPLCQI